MVHILLDEKYCGSALIDLADDIEVLLDKNRRKAERRLVNQQQLRRSHQSSSDRHHGLLTARHGAGELQAALGQAREDTVDLGHAYKRNGIGRLLIGAEAVVLLNREFRKNLAAFRDARHSGGDYLVGRQRSNVAPIERDAASARWGQA